MIRQGVLCVMILLGHRWALCGSYELQAQHEQSLKVLSYNVRGLPWFTRFRDKTELSDGDRYKYIARVLGERLNQGDLDLVAFQEVMSSKAMEIAQLSKAPFFEFGPHAEGRPYNSGLLILSRHPIVEVRRLAFAELDRGACAFPECLASKGLLGVKIWPKDQQPFWVINTHLQANTTEDPIRRRQIELMDGFVRDLLGGSDPVFFIGDFNFKPNKHESYDYFSEKFPEFVDAGGLCLESEECERDVGPGKDTPDAQRYSDRNDIYKSNHDRQYFARAGEISIQLRKVSRVFDKKVAGGFLSDHFGYECEYRLSLRSSQ